MSSALFEKHPDESLVCSPGFQEALMMHAQEFYALQGKVQFDLSNSNTEPLVLSELLNDADSKTQTEFWNMQLNYSHPQGERDLLNAIAGLYDAVNPEEILVQEGSEEALLLLLECLLEPSEHLIMQFPCYPPALEIAVSRAKSGDSSSDKQWNPEQLGLWQGEIKKIVIRNAEITKDEANQNRWVWSLEKLEALLQPNTPAIFLCSPHNPTGALMTKSEYQELIAFARKHDLLLICDEVYRLLEYNDAERLPPIVESYEQGISIGSLSKAFALPGLRTGWLAIKNQELRSKLVSYKSRTTLCNSVVTQYLAELALRKKEFILKKVKQRVLSNRDLLRQFVNTYSEYFEWVEPQSASVAFLALRNHQDAEVFCRELAEKASVLCLPGRMFSYEPHYFRVGFGKAHFDEAIDAMDCFMKSQFQARK